MTKPRHGGRRPGAGRPRAAEPTRLVSFRLPAAIHGALELLAAGAGVSVSSAAREIVVADIARR